MIALNHQVKGNILIHLKYELSLSFNGLVQQLSPNFYVRLYFFKLNPIIINPEVYLVNGDVSNTISFQGSHTLKVILDNVKHVYAAVKLL